ncbi:hypothetical protein OG538_19035 [Streptomyces sp. NBC_01013]|nr:hypothetical protein OG538_19035 [Streptomyces sp. NBC_01013]
MGRCRVEDAGDWTADRLEDVGWDSGADWVREQSRSVANRMGAEVEEMDLGQTEDKMKLIYGSPSEIRSTATLKNLQGALDKVGGGLKGLDASELKGKTADAFRDSVSVEPPQWFKAADAFEKAAGALESFAGTVEWAQGQAQLAIDKVLHRLAHPGHHRSARKHHALHLRRGRKPTHPHRPARPHHRLHP